MANAQCQFTQGATVGGDGQSVLGFVASTLVTLTDKGGAGAISYAWEVLNWPAPLSSAPVITNSTSQVATVTLTTAGVYIVKLTRVDAGSGTTTDTQFIGIADDEGHHLPVAGMSGNMTNVGASPALAQAAGWMGREDASTNVLLDAYLRWLKTAAKNVQSFPLVSGKQVAQSDSWRVVGSLQLDPTGYPSYSQATFQVALSVTSGQTAEVRLYNVTDGEVVASSTQTSTSTTTEVKSATVTLPSAEKLYEVHLRLANPNGGSDEAVCSEARLTLVDPTGATYTEVGHTLDADTLALWRFNETSQGKARLDSAADVSGSALTLAPSTPSDWNRVPSIIYGPAGASQHARWFGSSLSNLRRSMDSSLAAVMTSDFTIEFWVYVEDLSGDRMMFETGDASETEANNVLLQFLVTTGGNLSFLWEYGSGTNVAFTTVSSYISVRTWYHVAVTCSESGGTRTLKVYVDGDYKETTSGTNASGGSTGYLTFGYSMVNADRPMWGSICDARLSDKERTSVEIAADAAASDYRHTVDGNTTALWRFDEAPEVRDEVGLLALNTDTITNGVPIGSSMLDADERSRIMLVSDEYLRIPQRETFRQILLGDFSFEMWFRFSDKGATASGWTHITQDLLSIYGTTGETLATNYLFLLSFVSERQLRPRIFWEYDVGTDVEIFPASAVFSADDAVLPHHLAITKENTGTNTCTLVLYVDGVAVTSYTDGSDTPISNTGLRRAEGGTASTALWKFKGLDAVWEDVRLSGKVRTADEVLASYNQRTPHRT